METDPKELQEQLRAADRGEAATWIDYPPTPHWWSPLFGVWTAAFVMAIGYLDGWQRPVAELGLVVVMGGLIGYTRAKRGTYPKGRMPRELHQPMMVLIAGAVVVALLCWLVGEVIAVWAAAVLGLVLVWALVAGYEKMYASASTRARARLR